MKVKIFDFGPLKEFEFDLSKKITVTYGDNNIGKSYAMQILYLLLKSIINNRPVRYSMGTSKNTLFGVASSSNYGNNIFHILENIIQGFLESGFEAEDITDEIKTLACNLMATLILPDFVSSCKNTFGNYQGLLVNKPHIIIEADGCSLDLNMRKENVTGEVELSSHILKKSDNNTLKSRKYKKRIYVYVNKNSNLTALNILNDSVRSKYYELYEVLQDGIGRVLFLPASRSGIYNGMSAFASIVAELSKNRDILTRKIELPGLSEPISDYFIMLSKISIDNGWRVPGNSDSKRLCDIIENEILKGTVKYDINKKTLLYTPNGKEESFEMSEVSSMVSEISPIVAYLKYIIRDVKGRRRSNTLMFIEEPEAHLHPGNQIKLIDIFTQFMEADISLVISSHSNYVFNKLNNLVLSGRLDNIVYQPIILEETNEGSIARKLFIDECGVNDENFIDVSEELYNEREIIIREKSLKE